MAYFALLAIFSSVAVGALAQSSAYGQCGGQGWSGATTCVSGYTCVVSNPYYSQCLPGAAPSSSSPTVTLPTITHTGTTSGTTTVKSTSGSAPTGTSTALPTLLPNQLWIRADEQPDFHYYLQSATLNEPGDAIIGPINTAAQFNVVNGQLTQFTPSGTKLYGQLYPPASGTTRMKLFFTTTPATNVTWSFSGDTLEATTPGFTQKQGGIWLACDDSGDTTRPNIYVNLGNFDYMTPTGCADETLNYYNGATPTMRA